MAASRLAVLASLLLAPALAGCLVAPGSSPDALSPLPDGVRLLDPRGLEVEVPVDVVLVGFESGTAAALQEALAKPLPVRHAVKDDWNTLRHPDHPQVPSLTDALVDLPLVPVARFRVHEAQRLLVSDLVEAARLAPGLLDGNAAEDLLAARLPALGVPLRADAPSLVFLHLGGTLGDHAWRYHLPNGHMDPVRVFGERLPLLVLDASAAADPAVVRDQASQAFDQFVYEPLLRADVQGPMAYDFPLAPGGAATLAALRDAAVDAVHFRLLQGTGYHPSLRPCHAVSILVGVRGTSLSERGLLGAAGQVDVEVLRAAWQGLTGVEVRVTLRVLALPQDDPVLDALTRPGPTGGILGGLDAFRTWAEDHWADYLPPGQGCEEHLSVLVAGDPVEPGGAVAGGIAMVDHHRGRRISVSVEHDAERWLDAPDQDPSRGRRDVANFLLAHETGHLLGQMHPHTTLLAESGERREVRSWSSVWSPMSYQTGDRLVDFGVAEPTNHARARAGFAVQAARDAGLDGAPAFAEALSHVAANRWAEAWTTLRPQLPEDATGLPATGFPQPSPPPLAAPATFKKPNPFAATPER